MAAPPHNSNVSLQMRRVSLRALAFAAVPLVLADLLLWVFYQGAQPAELRDQLLLLHGALFTTVFILAAVGSAASFFIWRVIDIRPRAILVGGVLFSVATFFVSMPAFAFGGPVVVGIWLLAGAAVFAAGACRWGRVNAG